MNKIENVVTPMTRFAAALGSEPSEALEDSKECEMVIEASRKAGLIV